MRWSLRSQLLVPLVGITFAAVSLVSGLAAWTAARRAERQIDAQLDAMAATLRNSTYPLTDPVLAQVHGLSGVEVVRLDDNRQIVAASLDATSRATFRPPQRSSGHRLPIVSIGGDRYFDRVVPEPERAGEARGELHLLYPERAWREGRREAIVGSLAVGGLALGLAVVAAVTMANRLSRPITRLRNQVGRIAAGQYEPLPLPERDDELRDLAASVNRLATRLTELTDSLRRGERLALLGQVSGGLAHQLRNSIAGAKIAVQLHQRHCPGDEARSLEVALRQLALTEEHLLSFLTAGQPRPLRRSTCRVHQILAELRGLVEPMARHRQVELRWGAAPPELSLSADADQLRELLLNLVLNALDAAGPGGWVSLTVERRPRSAAVAGGQAPASDELLVQVRDSGPGPPAELRERMFEPLVTGKPEGIGLGLAAARRIAQAHGGHIDYDRDETTCFSVALPLVTNEVGDEPSGS